MDRQRHKICQTLASAGGRFHGEQAVVAQRVFDALGHFQLLRTWFVAVEEPRDYAAGFQKFLSRRQGLGVHVEPSYADVMRFVCLAVLAASLLFAGTKPPPPAPMG